nr:reverse transcriptase domain-containing protein [Tanacetum cinerariifolium]
MEKGKENESPLSRVSKGGTSDSMDGGHWKTRVKRLKPADEEDLSVPWTCEDVDPFTPRIRNFKSSRKTRMPNNVKTFDGTGDPKDQAAAQVERWAMPTWGHMFNYTLIGAARVWFDELPPESIDGYKGLKEAFLAYFMQQKKYVKNPVKIHNIKQRDGKTIEEFIERFKIKTERMKGAPECMRIYGFMHGVNNPELTKRLNEHVPKTVEEMMTATTAFIRGETAVASKKKVHTSWKSQDQTPKEIFAAESGKFKPPPPMVTPVEKRSSNKFCEFHNEKGHSTDECMKLKKQIEELLRAGKLLHFIKEIRQDRDQQKTRKKDAPVKDKAATIYMIWPWQRVTRQKVTQSFAHVKEITFPPLTANKGTGGPFVIEAKIGGHAVHCIYIDGGSSMEHYTKAWMNFMIVRSPSSYNGIIGRPGIREIQAVPSTAYGMLKFSVNGEIVTIRSTILTPTECATIATTPKDPAKKAEARHENFKVAIHPDFPDQEITIGGAVSTKAPTELCTLLKGNLDIFAWQPSDMTGVPRSIFKHRLDIREGYSPVRQKKMRQAPERAKAIQVEVQKLVEAGILLKNDGATYQRLVDKAFDRQIGQNLEIYVDDLVIKSHTKTEPLRDIEETFRTLRKINMKLNPKKYTFEAAVGMFLGYMINPKGIKPCTDKMEAVLQLPSPRTIKERCIKKSDFHWTPETEQAFKQLKQHLAQLPMLEAPKPKEELIMYLPASYGAITAVLMTEKDTVQTLVYFVSRALQAPELNYTPMEKLVLALVCAAKRLRRYFQAHPIVVITDQPIKQVISHFLVEKLDDAPPEASVIETPQESWILFTDGSSCVDGSGVVLILTSPEGTEFTYALSVNSKLLANQVLGTYVAKEENMIKYLKKTKSLISGFANFSISQAPRSKNKKADALSKIASTGFAHLSKQVLVEVLKETSIQERKMVTVVEEEGLTWMTPIIEYLRDETLPDNRKEASKLRIKARQYELLEWIFYRRLKPWLRYVGPLQADYVIWEIHDGSCNYQIHRPVPRHPQQPLTSITAPWSFYKWGIDIVGPFLEGLGKVKFLIVAMDYFTKWIEAKAVAIISGSQVNKFVWDNIVCRFGLPREIVTDKGKQFSGDPFKDWCEKLNIVQRFASLKHPQSNGLVERVLFPRVGSTTLAYKVIVTLNKFKAAMRETLL